MYSGIIYKATNPQNSRAFIGASVQTLARVKAQHTKAASAPNPKGFFHRELKEYERLTTYTWEVLEKVEAESPEALKTKLAEREKHYIRKFRTYDRCFGYNTPAPREKNERCERKSSTYHAIYHLDGYNATYVERFPTMHQAREAYGRRLNFPAIDREFLKDDWRILTRNNPDADYVAVRLGKTQRHPKTLRIKNRILRVENRHLRGEDKLPDICFIPPKKAGKTQKPKNVM